MKNIQTKKISLFNGRIHTPEGLASCLIFEHGRINSIANLNPDELDADCEKINLKGKTVIPSFCDGNEKLTEDISDFISKVKIFSSMGITELWLEFDGENFSQSLNFLIEEVYDTLPFRIRCNFKFLSTDSLKNFLSTGLRTGDGRPMCRIGAAIIGSNIDPHEQKNMTWQAHVSGMQVICEGSKTSITMLERASRKFKKTNPRHLILNPGDNILEKMKISGFGGIATSDSNAEINFKSAFQNGIVINAGSDKEIQAPLKIMGELSINKNISFTESLNLYTWGAAWNGKVENRRGELIEGNDADFIILERDPFLVHPGELEHVEISMTFCAGVKVFDIEN